MPEIVSALTVGICLAVFGGGARVSLQDMIDSESPDTKREEWNLRARWSQRGKRRDQPAARRAGKYLIIRLFMAGTVVDGWML